MAKARKVVTRVKRVVTESVPRIELQLTTEEAGILMQLLMCKVEWATSGEFGRTCREIYDELATQGAKEARWFTTSGQIWQSIK